MTGTTLRITVFGRPDPENHDQNIAVQAGK